mgnify:CR=1 FL=1
MKKFKKLIPAFCAMLVSAAMLGTSTYAWFSVNKKVEAKGMSVTAKVATEYFVATTTAPTENKFVVPADNATEVTFTTEEAKSVVPVAKASGTLTLGETTINKDDWYTGSVKTYDDTNQKNWATLSKLTYTSVSEGLFTQETYFVSYTFYIGLAKTSADYEGALTFTPVKTTGHVEGIEIAGVKVEGNKKGVGEGTNLTTNSETLEIFTAANATTKEKYVLKADGTSYVTVTVYLCINGEDANVKDSNAAKLTGTIGVNVVGA